MRLVTWNLGQRPNGGHAPDDVITALATLEPDIVIMTERLSGPARRSFLAALAGLGLTHQLAPASAQRGDHVLIASRLSLVPGSMREHAARDDLPSNMLHAYAPTGILDVVGVRSADPGSRPATRRARWESLFRAARTLRQRRSILIGDFDVDASDAHVDGIDHLRQLTDAGWRHAVPTGGSGYPTARADEGRLDHAFLSPSVQQIDARYTLAVAGFRVTGTHKSLSAQPVLVVDLQ